MIFGNYKRCQLDCSTGCLCTSHCFWCDPWIPWWKILFYCFLWTRLLKI